MNNHFRTLLIGASLLACGVVFAQARTDVRLFTLLSGPRGKGKAAWKASFRPGQVQGEFKVEAENLAPNTIYRVTAPGIITQNVRTSALGAFNINLTYRTNPLPNVLPGAKVSVFNGQNLVLAGILQ